MPCENCSTQFTVFKRKKSCSECRRVYCNHCLVKRCDKVICCKCVIFTARPLSRIDLLKLKPKDLIFYLQSKHISTTGCVEKEDLVNLVVLHVNSGQLPSSATHGHSQGHGHGHGHAYAQTHTHQTAGSGYNSESANCSNPFDQIKQTCQSLFSSFAEKLSNDINFDLKSSSRNQPTNISAQPRSGTKRSAPPPSAAETQSRTTSLSPSPPPPLPLDSRPDTTNNSTSPTITVRSEAVILDDLSSGSSFEDLTPTYVNQNIPLVQQTASGNVSISSLIQIDDVFESICCCTIDSNVQEPLCEQNNDDIQNAGPSGIVPKLTGHNDLSRQSVSSGSSNEELGATGGEKPIVCSEKLIIPSTETGICTTCGKNTNLRNSFIQFQKQSASSENNRIGQLEAFITYLEATNFANTPVVSLLCGGNTVPQIVIQENGQDIDLVDDNSGDGDGDGGGGGGGTSNADYESDVNVNGSGNGTPLESRALRKFVNLKNIRSRSELDALSVKQLKEILALNRVDFKGCCEKNELLERVYRLWNENSASPSTDKLPTDDLCKVCMDAPIECVILECGHMATCTNCGKVLSECPICRQYIVRVVRIFRA